MLSSFRLEWVAPWLALVGCGPARSTSLDTGGFHVIYSVVSAPTAPPLALAELRVEDRDGSLLELVGGDMVRCNDTPLRLLDPALPAPAEAVEQGMYGASIPDASSAVFTLERVGESYSHEVAIPAPLALKLATSEARYGDEVEVIWTAVPGATVRLTAASSGEGCPAGVTLADNSSDCGSRRIVTGALQPPSAGGEAPRTCTFVLTLTQVASRAIGAPFHGGELHSIAIAQASLVLR